MTSHSRGLLTVCRVTGSSSIRLTMYETSLIVPLPSSESSFLTAHLIISLYIYVIIPHFVGDRTSDRHQRYTPSPLWLFFTGRVMLKSFWDMADLQRSKGLGKLVCIHPNQTVHSYHVPYLKKAYRDAPKIIILTTVVIILRNHFIWKCRRWV